MKRFLILAAFNMVCFAAFAQIEEPLRFTGEDENQLIKEADGGKYFTGAEDSSYTVFLGDDPLKYKLFNKDHKVIADGLLVAEGNVFLHEGKWTEYYDNGKVKSTGMYYKDHPIGNWQRFYEDGKLKLNCTFTLIENGAYYSCMTGDYKEYYENGKSKTTGFYKAVFDESLKDTVMVVNPDTGGEEMKTVKSTKPHAIKFGTWQYYNEQGELLKKEDF